MKNNLYYHIYMPDDNSWASIFTDQMERLLNSNLCWKVNKFKITCIGKQDAIQKLVGLLKYYNHVAKFPIELKAIDKRISDNQLGYIDSMVDGNVVTETETLSSIYHDCLKAEEPFNVLYFHAKGVTAIERQLNTGNYGNFVNLLHWRKHLDWFAFDKYDECMERLQYSDVVGTNFCSWPSPHYSGNYWWTTSEYIKKLPDPKDRVWWDGYKKDHPDLYRLPDRLVAEMWIGSGNGSMSSLYFDKEPPPISNLGEKLILNYEYI